MAAGVKTEASEILTVWSNSSTHDTDDRWYASALPELVRRRSPVLVSRRRRVGGTSAPKVTHAVGVHADGAREALWCPLAADQAHHTTPRTRVVGGAVGRGGRGERGERVGAADRGE